MTDYFDAEGNIVDERTSLRVQHMKDTAVQHFLCLIDSGAGPVVIKALTQKLCEAMAEASDKAIADLLQQLEGIEEEDDEAVGEGQI